MSAEQVRENEQDQQVDFVPDAEETAPEKEPSISCVHCVHKDTCYFLTVLDQSRQSFEASGICALPFKPTILATTCKKFDNGKSVADNLTEQDTEVHPDDAAVEPETSEEIPSEE